MTIQKQLAPFRERSTFYVVDAINYFSSAAEIEKNDLAFFMIPISASY